MTGTRPDTGSKTESALTGQSVRWSEIGRRALTSPVTVATAIVLVVPFALGWLRTELFSPLALPGYVIYSIGTAIGNAIAPRFEFWVYWLPFLGGCYGIAVSVGAGYEWLRARRATVGAIDGHTGTDRSTTGSGDSDN
ncbi:uncharacterized protein Nmag_0589 [Natrialba magadii ATCC 43099]|uniref:Uncharacterized protein n=1 Tax=Natrialba magadii (strain ATCC 43099 / DSM 3394 / CCM 3739 / CIP 104546 / IAM 13178 / JCM 8861 / NBRC 102185 / NCIMB 2190 / MS3) TaxID=547559 RepID=D3SYR5_NATMM|nr:hypothetical protein [Natrialba magadii]ADD04176.1 uncharacterized protein Nmag_0589 [Natrialba magadii ATCC 43099]